MKNILLLLSLCTLSSYASEAKKGSESQESLSDHRKAFESNKAKLSTSLKGFVTDFETWPKEDKSKITIRGLSFMISGLSAERQAPYSGNVGYWIDCRTQTQQQRVLFINCLKYLQQ